jgi:D-3-phosphoglycerate dehydrogenase
VARRARGFDMRILGYDIVWDDDWTREAGVERADVNSICAEADIITLHTALTYDTRGMIGARQLAVMKKSAIVINTARGGLIDEAVLLAALRDGRIYGAGIDAFAREPPTDAAWYKLDNLVMGSHCSASTYSATETMGRMATDNLLRDLHL